MLSPEGYDVFDKHIKYRKADVCVRFPIDLNGDDADFR